MTLLLDGFIDNPIVNVHIFSDKDQRKKSLSQLLFPMSVNLNSSCDIDGAYV